MLIYNEIIKLFSKKSTISFIIIVFSMGIITAYFNKLFLNHTEAATYIYNLGNTYSFMNIFVVIVASSIISSEFSTGTFRLLFIRPCSRIAVFLSKWFVAIFFLCILSIVLFVSCLLGAVLFLNLENVLVPQVEWQGLNAIEFAIKTILANGLLGLLYIGICFFISSICRSQVMSVSISLAILLLAPILNLFNSYLIMKVNSLFNFSIVNILTIRDVFIGNIITTYRKNYLTFTEMLICEFIYLIILLILGCILFNRKKFYLNYTE